MKKINFLLAALITQALSLTSYTSAHEANTEVTDQVNAQNSMTKDWMLLAMNGPK